VDPLFEMGITKTPVNDRGGKTKLRCPINSMQVREMGSPGLSGICDDEHDGGGARIWRSYYLAVYQAECELASVN
jgi:hypothetical protein